MLNFEEYYVEALQAVRQECDAHQEADQRVINILLELLSFLGYNKVVEEYLNRR